MNTDDPWPDADSARWRVLKIQTKLHQWATDDSDRRFDDLYNLVYDPAVLVDAWQRVKGNRGARSAGVDGQTALRLQLGDPFGRCHTTVLPNRARNVVDDRALRATGA